MPALSITLIDGYSDVVKQRLAHRLTLAVRSTIAADPAGITVMLHEVSRAGYMRGGRAALAPGETPAPHDGPRAGAPYADASALVSQFLQAMQERNLDQAQAFLHTDFEMEFPGGNRFRTLTELIDWSKSRYASIGKNIESLDESWYLDKTVVWCTGTLYGTWPDGQAFEGIRFTDRFEVVDGLFTRQQVWNDLGEARDRR